MERFLLNDNWPKYIAGEESIKEFIKNIHLFFEHNKFIYIYTYRVEYISRLIKLHEEFEETITPELYKFGYNKYVMVKTLDHTYEDVFSIYDIESDVEYTGTDYQIYITDKIDYWLTNKKHVYINTESAKDVDDYSLIISIKMGRWVKKI